MVWLASMWHHAVAEPLVHSAGNTRPPSVVPSECRCRWAACHPRSLHLSGSWGCSGSGFRRDRWSNFHLNLSSRSICRSTWTPASTVVLWWGSTSTLCIDVNRCSAWWNYPGSCSSRTWVVSPSAIDPSPSAIGPSPSAIDPSPSAIGPFPSAIDSSSCESFLEDTIDFE